MLHWMMKAQSAIGVRSFWMPQQASTYAAGVDSLYYFIYWLCVFFFVLIVAMMTVFVIKYRKRSEDDKTSPIDGSHTLEIVWSVIPTILLVIIFVWGFRDWVRMSTPPQNTLDVRVTAQKWSWSFNYPKDGIDSADLVVPANTPVKLIMSSKDVIHSFYVPDFRIKRDVLPNRYTVIWFEATSPGEYQVFCTEYCGTAHSEMLSKVKVVTDDEYRAWIDSGGGMSGKGMSAVDFGKKLFESKACVTCHSVDGSPKVGPSLKGVFGRQESLADGSSALVDDNYVRESIMEPNAKVVKGFAPQMPSYKGQLKDEQVTALIEYIKSLQ